MSEKQEDGQATGDLGQEFSTTIEADHPTPRYVYHWKPEDMRGETLYPLNELKSKYPDLYTEAADQYENREFLRDYVIPPLGCKWNDALFLSPIGPEQIRAALLEQDFDFHGEFYEIDASKLAPERTTIYTFKDIAFDAVLDPNNYVPYSPENLKRLSTIPEATKQFYKENLTDEGVLYFAHIPHILYRGTLDVTDVRTIKV